MKQQEDYVFELCGQKSFEESKKESIPTMSSSHTFISYLQSHSKSEVVCNYRYKLCQILQTSEYYNVTKVISTTESLQDLKIEKAILLSKVKGKKEEAK